MTHPLKTSANLIHILLIEDSRIDAAIVTALLTHHSEFRVTSTPSFQEAIGQLTHTKYDAVVLDLGLPDSSGAESIRILRQQFSEVPVIVLSGNEEEVAVLRALQYGAEVFLTKNQIDNEDLRQTIFNAIFRKSLRKRE